MKIKHLPLMFAVSLGCVACAETKKPEPDPAKLEAFIATLDNEGKAPGKAERLIASVEKVPLERVDPDLVAAVAN